MEGGSYADGAGSSKVKEYNWVVVGSERKHPVSYNASHGWLTVDGRHGCPLTMRRRFFTRKATMLTSVLAAFPSMA